MTGVPKLLIAEHGATRHGIRMVLDRQVEVCAEAADSEQAIRAAMREQPDVCLVGRELPGGALHAVRGICRAAPNAAVLVLVDGPEVDEGRDVDEMLEFIRVGAIGYVTGGLDAERLLRIIHAVEANEAVVPRSMVLGLVLELRGGGAGGDLLTPREAQVLRLFRNGHTTAAIAERLQISPVTVRRHISGLKQKLGVEDRTALMRSGDRWSGLEVDGKPRVVASV